MRGRKRVLLAERKESVKTCKLTKCLMAWLICIYVPDSSLIKRFIRTWEEQVLLLLKLAISANEIG